MKKKSKTTGIERARKSARLTKQAASPKLAHQGKPSGYLEGSAASDLPKKNADDIIAKHGEEAYKYYFDSEDGKFSVGAEAGGATKELQGTSKRVPNDFYVCRALSQYLQKKGIRDVSSSTIYDWMRSDETREALGGKDKAPKISISFYVAVSRDEIPMEKRREHLEYAIKHSLTVGGLKERICGGAGARETADDCVPNGGTISDIAIAERIISESHSLLSGNYNEFRAISLEENSSSIALLENLAIYAWQIRDDIANGGAKKGEPQ